MTLETRRLALCLALLAAGVPAAAQEAADDGTEDTATETEQTETAPATDDAAEAPADGPATTEEPAAEEDPAAENETTETPDAGLGSGPSDLSLGVEVEDEEAVGRTYIRETYGDWSLRCVRTGTDEDPCQLYQLLNDGSGNAVAEVTLFGLDENSPVEAGMTIVTPLETLLTQQLTVSVDGGTTKRYPFTFCTQIGCFARIGLTSEEVAAFKRGANANVRIFPVAAPDQPVDLAVSLSGFTAGYDAVTALPQATQAP